MNPETKTLLDAATAVINTEIKFSPSLDSPEVQLEEVLGMLEAGTKLYSKLYLHYEVEKLKRKDAEAGFREATRAHSLSKAPTVQQLEDSIRTKPEFVAMNLVETGLETALEGVKKHLDLYASYRETLFRLISLNTAETRNR
jgi:hypothetical protein